MLDSYDRKRDFDRTREPAPTRDGEDAGDLRFVVQKHAARRLHYDFRLEIDGVLKSWPVPKGPSLDPREKRLAVMVEDHPLDYATFEGVISHGNYGAGEVIVWDSGTYSPDEDGRLSFGDRDEAQERMRPGLECGKLSFTLRGRKMRGSWTLVRTARAPNDWLLIKHRDGFADPERDILLEERSVQSGLTIDDLKAGRVPDAVASPVGEIGRRGKFPARLKPMLARLADEPFSHPDWLFEPKLDGFRALAFLRDGHATLSSRTGNDLTPLYPDVVSELEGQPEGKLVLDGEIVALDSRGVPDFGLLQQTISVPEIRVPRRDETATVVYYVFDILYAGGMDLRRESLADRKDVLDRLLVPGERLRLVEQVEGDGDSFFQAAVGLGLEGIVAKRRDSIYRAGTRSGAWLKIKGQQSQEFVVGGYTTGTGARADTFGALLLGYYDGGALRYAGRVGSGFSKETLEGLAARLHSLEVGVPPFADDVEPAKTVTHWTHPELVARIRFAQWTHEGHLRAPVFIELAGGIDPGTVRRERAVATPTSSPTRGGSSPGGSEVAEVLDQLSGSQKSLLLQVGGHVLSLTNLDKVLWPGADRVSSYTKGDMIRYYARVAPALLPHLRDRALTLTRYPDGIEGESFYQKHWEHTLPDFVETVNLYSSHNDVDSEYILVNNLPTLIWLAQVADIELHPWLSRTVQQPDASHLTTSFTGSREEIQGSVLNYPDFVVFDLDPYIYSGKERAGDEPELNRRAFVRTAEVARALKEVLDELSLSSFLKTSGKTGLHVYVPVLRQYDYKVTRKTCELIGRFLMQSRPDDVTMEWSVSKRTGKIFLDHNQNARGKNMASIYSLRPLPGAPVSTPLRWTELGDAYPTDFTLESVPERIDTMGDLWAGVLDAKHDLRRLLDAQ